MALHEIRSQSDGEDRLNKHHLNKYKITTMMASMKEGYMMFWEHRDRTVLESQRRLPGESRYVGGKKKGKPGADKSRDRTFIHMD